MKYSDKLALYLKGVKSEEIKALEEQEKAEMEEAAAKEVEEEAKEESDTKKQLEEALTMIKDLESKLEAKDAELVKQGKEIESMNNKKTLQEQPTTPDASDVFKQLFNPTTKEEK